MLPYKVFEQLSSGWTHTCGLTLEHDVVCWGSNLYGESEVGGGGLGTM